MWAEALQYK